jgi:catechol 2,3-dioxygenase-like lactoylglutathione lyase family enzyme
VLGGLHHLAISMEPAQWERVKAKLDAAGVEYQQMGRASLYFRDPDGTRLELTREPLGQMSGARVL